MDGWRIFRIMAEFVEGFETMSKVGKAVTIFGSARTQPDGPVLQSGGRNGAAAGEGEICGDHRGRPGNHGGSEQGRLRRAEGRAWG